MKSKLDKSWIGFLLGIILPVIFGYVYLRTNLVDGYSLVETLRFVSASNMTVKLMCVALFPNMAIVFLLNSFEMWHACRGVFASIFIYLAISLSLIFF